jgi:hypothetical protein
MMMVLKHLMGRMMGLTNLNQLVKSFQQQFGMLLVQLLKLLSMQHLLLN